MAARAPCRGSLQKHSGPLKTNNKKWVFHLVSYGKNNMGAGGSEFRIHMWVDVCALSLCRLEILPADKHFLVLTMCKALCSLMTTVSETRSLTSRSSQSRGEKSHMQTRKSYRKSCNKGSLIHCTRCVVLDVQPQG